MNKKIIQKLMLTLLALVLSSTVILAIGVTPGRTTIDFEQNQEETITVEIVNNEHKLFNAYIYPDGELKEYLNLEYNLLQFTPEINSLSLTYKFKALDLKPGKHMGEIVIVELPYEESLKNKGQVVGATTAVITQLMVNVPYPGKYAEFNIETSETSNKLTFILPVSNLGTEDIKDAKARIEIFGPTNDKITSLDTESMSLQSKKRQELVTNWDISKVNPGKYFARITLYYDGNQAKAEKVLEIGNQLIEVKDVSVKNFRLGGVAKFNIKIENRWNAKIDEVYAQMQILKDNGDVFADFKSASIPIEAYDTETLYAYWDTEGVKEGVYDAKLILHYNGKSTETHLRAIVSLDNIRTELTGITGKAISGTRLLRKDSILSVLVITLIIINISWFFYFRKKRNP